MLNDSLDKRCLILELQRKLATGFSSSLHVVKFLKNTKTNKLAIAF